MATQAPKGFDVKIGREDGDGWGLKKEGNTIQGRLVGRYQFRNADGETRSYYQIKLDEPCKATTKAEEGDKDGKDGYKEITLKPGQIVNVDEVAKLSDLAGKCSDGGVYDVWFRYLGKKPRKGTKNTPWNFDGPYLKVIKAPPKDNIPF